MSIGAQAQAAAWRIRRRNRSGKFIHAATPWAAGLIVIPGDIVQSNKMAWKALNGGVTAGTTAPDNANGASFTDGGGVQWLHIPLLLTVPTPI